MLCSAPSVKAAGVCELVGEAGGPVPIAVASAQGGEKNRGLEDQGAGKERGLEGLITSLSPHKNPLTLVFNASILSEITGSDHCPIGIVMKVAS